MIGYKARYWLCFAADGVFVVEGFVLLVCYALFTLVL